MNVPTCKRNELDAMREEAAKREAKAYADYQATQRRQWRITMALGLILLTLIACALYWFLATHFAR